MPTPGKLALWRLQYEELHALMVNTREQFMAWSEDLGALELQNQTVEFRRCVAEIKRNLQRYRETIKKLPTAAAFTDEAVENKSGNVSLGLRLVGGYLDRKGAVAFSIWWSIESVKVRYEAPASSLEETSFTMQNVWDLGTGMYLRRSNRQLTT